MSARKLTANMRGALASMVHDGPGVGFDFDWDVSGAEDCVSLGLATAEGEGWAREYTATELGIAALDGAP